MSRASACDPTLTIRGGQIVTADRQYSADLRVCGEKIAEISRNLPPGDGRSEIDARGLFVLPGGIDPHVHLTVPGPVPPEERWVDDLGSGSRAALAGGITTLGNISFPLPGETPLDTVEREERIVEQQSIADVILHPVLLPPIHSALRVLPQLVAKGCTTIKIFMSAEEFDTRVNNIYNTLSEKNFLHIYQDLLRRVPALSLGSRSQGESGRSIEVPDPRPEIRPDLAFELAEDRHWPRS